MSVQEPTTLDQFLELGQQSGLLDLSRARACLHCREDETLLTPAEAARLLVQAGLLTGFQAERLLQGRWRNFIISGRYKVLDRLGSGGMAQVYLCEQVALRRKVALKVLPPGQAANPAAVQRFQREALATAALDHPHIVRAIDVGQEGTLHYLVMDYVVGIDLSHLVKFHGPLEVARACHYVRQAALGLQHAYEHGVVHRDIKPANLLVDRSGTVKVLDMGLARFFHDEQDQITQELDGGAVLGTADYLPPEQAVNSHEVDIRGDIYSLGATLYFLLTGKPPFGEGTVAQKLIWHQIRTVPSVQAARPEVPEALAAVLLKMMAKDPADRYPEPGAVAAALAPWTALPIPPPAEAEMPHASGQTAILGTYSVPTPRRMAPATGDPTNGHATDPWTADQATRRLDVAEQRRAVGWRPGPRLVKAGGGALLAGLVLGLVLLFRPGGSGPPTSAPVRPTEQAVPLVRASQPALVIHCGRGGGNQETEVIGPGYDCRLVRGHPQDGWGAPTAKSHAWIDGREIRFQLKLPSAIEGRLRLHFVTDNPERKVRVVVHGKSLGDVDNFQGAGKWLEVPVTPALLQGDRLDVAVQNLLDRHDAVVSTVEFVPLVPRGSEPPRPAPALVVQCGRENGKRQSEVVTPRYYYELQEGQPVDGWSPQLPRTHGWQGNKVRFCVVLPAGVAGTLRLFFLDPDHRQRKQAVFVRGRLVAEIEQFAGAGKWLEVPLSTADTRDGAVQVILDPRAPGLDALISSVEFVPRQAPPADPAGGPALVLQCGRGGGAAWRQEERIARGYGYRFLQGLISDGGSGPMVYSYCWQDANAVRFEVVVPPGTPGTLRLLLVDDNSLRGEKVIVGQRTIGEYRNVPPKGKWLDIPLQEADTADGNIAVTLQNLPNAIGAALSTVEFVPTKK